MLRKVLVTGFEAFGKEKTNPTAKLAAGLDGKRVLGSRIVGVVLPVSYRRVGESLRTALDEHKPDVVLGTGLWGGRSDVTVERVGINLMNARMPDNDGFLPKDVPIIAGGPAAYFSSLPHRKIIEHLRKAGIPATASYSAGTFICNALLYHLMNASAREGVPRIGGFLHVPNEPAEVALREGAFGMSKPSMALPLMQKAVEVAIIESLGALSRS
jgi:pyroglutamyl-peptidase